MVVLAAATALDMSRAPEQRTHLGRLVERIDDRGFGDFVVVVQRKLADNLGSLRSSVWGFVLPIALVLGALARPPRSASAPGAGRGRARRSRSLGTGLAIVALLGWAMNDSGIAIPGVMLSIAIASLGLAARAVRPRPPDRHAPAGDVQRAIGGGR